MQSHPIHDALGLNGDPFLVVPDTLNHYLSPGVAEILDEVTDAIIRRRGFVVITGEVGLGKTTLTRALLAQLEGHRIVTSLILNTCIQGNELIAAINQDFGIEEKSTESLVNRLDALNHFLFEENQKGNNCLILIDDAQNLDRDSLELVRQISNLETNQEKLVQILLVGQPELEYNLDSFALRQLRSRIALLKRVKAFSPEDMEAYIRVKLNGVGARDRLTISRGAVQMLHAETRGNPRRINRIMDRALYILVASRTTHLNRRLLKPVIQEIKAESVKRPVVVGKPPKARKMRRMAMTAVAAALIPPLIWWIWPLLPRFSALADALQARFETVTTHEVISGDETVVIQPVVTEIRPVQMPAFEIQQGDYPLDLMPRAEQGMGADHQRAGDGNRDRNSRVRGGAAHHNRAAAPTTEPPEELMIEQRLTLGSQ